MKQLAVTGDSGRPIAMPSVCWCNWLLKLKCKEVRTWQKSLRVSSKYRLRKLTASLLSILVKSDTTLKMTIISWGTAHAESNVQTMSAEFM
jgi:hypothetical protein